MLRLYHDMLFIRRFEEMVERLFSEGRITGTAHTCIGQEAVAVGVASALRPEDAMTSTHRGHGHLLARGGDPVRLLSELFGLPNGYSGGRGGSQMMMVPSLGFYGTNGITGASVAFASGLALEAKMNGTRRVVAAFFGDGASSQGVIHETMNIASLWKLPIVFVCEVNGYAMSTPTARGVSVSSLAERARHGYAMKAAVVDGNDVVAVRDAMTELVAHARSGAGPAFLECRTYRLSGHSRGDQRVYRTREEEAKAKLKDPLELFKRAIYEEGVKPEASTAEAQRGEKGKENNTDNDGQHFKSCFGCQNCLQNTNSPVAKDALADIERQVEEEINAIVSATERAAECLTQSPQSSQSLAEPAGFNAKAQRGDNHGIHGNDAAHVGAAQNELSQVVSVVLNDDGDNAAGFNAETQRTAETGSNQAPSTPNSQPVICYPSPAIFYLPGSSGQTGAAYVRAALESALSAEPRVFLIGEDIGRYGGSFGVTRGLIDKFGPERIRDTPISEQAITGLAIGAAVAGARPIVEIMFMDFMTLCVDQLVNMAAKLKGIYGLDCPLVVRAAMGAGRSYGATHSQCLERLFAGIPGLKVVAGSNGPECAGLLLGALADPGPVIVLEHKLIYPMRHEGKASVTPIPPGSARVVREGTDVTIVAWSYMVTEALRAAEALAEEEIEAEVIDLRTILPIDADTLAASASKTGRVLVVEEGPVTGGISAEVACAISERARLAVPVRRLGMPFAPIPAARELERAVMPSAAAIADTARDLATVV